jgi:hypothetical protein
VTTYLGVAGLVFPVIALLVLIDSATLIGQRAHIRDLRARVDELERAASTPQMPQERPRPRPGTPDDPHAQPQGGTEALRAAKTLPAEPATVAYQAIRTDAKRPWQDAELDRWREQQAKRQPRTRDQEDTTR